MNHGLGYFKAKEEENLNSEKKLAENVYRLSLDARHCGIVKKMWGELLESEFF